MYQRNIRHQKEKLRLAPRLEQDPNPLPLALQQESPLKDKTNQPS